MPIITSLKVDAVHVPLKHVTAFSSFSHRLGRGMRHENGRIVLHQTPRLGFAFNEAILHEFVLTSAGAHAPWTAIGH